jgi:Holliday junction resolvase RusA-like endonuclease
MEITIEIPIIPVAQKRGRAGIIKGRDGRVFSHVYKDKGQRVQEDNFRALLYEYKPDTLMQGPLSLWIEAYLPMPKSKPKKWQEEANLGWIRPTTKPDVDNLAKHVKDCMQGIFYADDKEIVSLIVEKFYSDNPKWWIKISELIV